MQPIGGGVQYARPIAKHQAVVGNYLLLPPYAKPIDVLK
jgi:hypothetical protein